jgi:hypothetical protein
MANPFDDLIEELRVGSGWRYVTTATDKTKVYYSPRRTTRRIKGIVRTWLKFVEPDSDEIVGLDEFDCKGDRYRVLQETVFNSSGKGSTNSRASSWFYITPDSIIETVFEKLCSR